MSASEEKRYHSITPWITTKRTSELISFLKAAFNAEELGRVYNEDGSIGHAEVQIGDSKIMMFDSKPEWPTFPCFINLFVDDCEVIFAQAIKAGATIMTRITTQSWGDKGGRIIDPFGNVWWITSHVEDVRPEEIENRSKQNQYMDAMEYAQKSFDIQPILKRLEEERHG
jgi:uncharacterized glyoxalase superfamily protein PhnB